MNRTEHDTHRARKAKHKDVEYAVDNPSGFQDTFATFEAAAARAVILALSGKEVFIDVLVYSKAGARHVAGDEGVEVYQEDPEASVFQRLKIQVDDLGRIA